MANGGLLRPVMSLICLVYTLSPELMLRSIITDVEWSEITDVLMYRFARVTIYIRSTSVWHFQVDY